MRAKEFRGYVITLFVVLAIQVLAYIPAHPTNSSQEAAAGGLNVSDISKLYLSWYPNGSYSQNVSYQLAGNDSEGISKGALVHFSEVQVNNQTPPTTTPWIAMVSCDRNATDVSEEEDVFTLARDKGAVAALLYSRYSLGCVINPEYADPENFDQVFDIFSTQNLTSALLIEYQFGQLGPTNESIYGVYDSKRLNDSASIINSTVGAPAAPGYLFAVLQAYNSTGQIDEPPGDGVNTAGTTSQGGHSPNTALAMIILYAITGCVSALFCAIIVSGAIRAIRHPERYGPRARNGSGGFGQSRARGLTRAILDTFPVVKFGAQPGTSYTSDTQQKLKDIEAHAHVHSTASAMGLKEWQIIDSDGHNNLPQHKAFGPPLASDNAAVPSITRDVTKHAVHDQCCRPQNSASFPQDNDRGEGTSYNTPIAREEKDVTPASIGRETCPICIMDFEEGDDLRLLPCEGKHRFHQSCVDPWLLELSSSCPICREDFLALENIISGEPEGHDRNYEYDYHRPTHGGPPSTSGNRFSRYLRFAIHRQHNRGEEDSDPTDPYMPTASGQITYSVRQSSP